MEVSGQLHAPAALLPGKEPSVPWVAPTADLDAMARRKKALAPAGNRTPIVHPVA